MVGKRFKKKKWSRDDVKGAKRNGGREIHGLSNPPVSNAVFSL